ncbi:blast:Tudor domain-containing protein 1 [Drosophila guanche]|uniref:Blast:Tudor domain-containing protein 1 n=1 Tax=Drosophila guanche TaxID=7266 RepID=A0A3B0KN23_DROGU|nr:blast:Tudor domain-containing protein 1 [Drosophila guanche]
MDHESLIKLYLILSKLVRSVSAQQSGYAADALADIQLRYGHLHGRLQVSEQRLIEKLREASLPGQLELQQALDMLEGYEDVIKQLQQLLSTGSEVPKNLKLKELLQLAGEHLEKIPVDVKVNKQNGNPYSLSSTQLENWEHFQCDYMDPRIVVDFRSNYAPQGGSCTSSESSSFVSEPRERDQNRKRNFHWRENLERTFLAMDISTNEKVWPAPIDWFKTNALVSVLCINSPEDFYVQGVEAAQQLREALVAYAQTPSSTPTRIVAGELYMAYSKQEDRYHRVVVTRQLADQANTYEVFLPDIGLTMKLHSSNFHELPYGLTLLPFAAVHCCLSDLKPRQSKWWSALETAHFKMVLKNQPVNVIVTSQMQHQRHEVHLINPESKISLRDSFLYTGLARNRSGDWESPWATSEQRIPKAKHDVGAVLMIQMLHVNHPQEFYVMRHDYEGKRSELEDSLKSTMDRMDLSSLQNIFVGQLEMGCVMQLEERWVRVAIEMVQNNGFVLVRLVDFGSTLQVPWDRLYALPKAFMQKQRELSIKCCLADVETLQANDYAWTPEAIAAFKQLTSNPKLRMEVISVQRNVHRVTLDIVRSGVESVSVGVQMVALGHCASNGESSQKADTEARTLPLDVDARKLLEQQKGLESESQSQSQSEKQSKKYAHVELLCVQHPDEFYVMLHSHKAALKDLQDAVQLDADIRYDSNPIKIDWEEGDMCYAKVRAQGDLEKLWYRAIVLHVTLPTLDNSLPLYEVQLLDLGEVVRHVGAACMALMSGEHQKIAASAQRCQMYGLRPKNAEWTADNVDFFKDQLQAYDQLYVISHGRHGQTQRVVLYGSHTVSNGPFTPSRTRYVNINETLVLARVAEKNPDVDYRDDKDEATDTSTEKEQAEEQSLIDEIDDVTNVTPESFKSKPSHFEHCEGMPPMKLLLDLGLAKATTGQVKPPPAWLKPRPCEKSLYTGRVTYVNYDCAPYMSLATDKPFMEHMCAVLKKHFGPLKQRRCATTTYAVGQPVLVVYHLDKLLYRGIVQRKMNENRKYRVFFVDYGNSELATAQELLPFAPFPQLNALCWLVKIDGVRPKRGRYTIKELDTVHMMLVMKVCSVSVMDYCGPKRIPSCAIKVDAADIATMMMHSGMAVPVNSKLNKQKISSTPKQTLDESKGFVELQTLAVGGAKKERQFVGDENNLTALSSPPLKKKFKVKQNNAQGHDQDMDCGDVADMILDDDSSVSMELENADTDEGIANKDDEGRPDFSVCKEQLMHRISLSQQKKKDHAPFMPLDTSTVRSLYAGMDSFKSQILPSGLCNFKCSIGCLISATELQISPDLWEFTKRDIGLMQEISALVHKAAPLLPMLDDLCLARYSKDRLWYRAIIREVHMATKQATVYYVDFHDTETVDYAHLKVMPEQLMAFPLRSLCVKLHGVKRNKKFGYKTVYQALEACLDKHPEVFARVHCTNSNYSGSKDDRIDSVDSSSDSIWTGHKLIEVALYERPTSTKPLYEPLIENWMFLKK